MENNLSFLDGILNQNLNINDSNKKIQKKVEKKPLKIINEPNKTNERIIQYPIQQIMLNGQERIEINDLGLKVIYQKVKGEDGYEYNKYLVELIYNNSRMLSSGLVTDNYLITKIEPFIEYLQNQQKMKIHSKIFQDSKLVVKLQSSKINIDVDELIQLIYGVENIQYNLNLTFDIINGYSGFTKLQIIPGIRISDTKNNEELLSTLFPNQKIQFRHYNNRINIMMNLEEIENNILKLVNTLQEISITQEEFETNFGYLLRDYKKLYNFLYEWFQVHKQLNVLFMILMVEKYILSRQNPSYFKKEETIQKILKFVEDKL